MDTCFMHCIYALYSPSLVIFSNDSKLSHSMFSFFDFSCCKAKCNTERSSSSFCQDVTIMFSSAHVQNGMHNGMHNAGLKVEIH